LSGGPVKIQNRILLKRAIYENDREALGRLHTIYYTRIKHYIASFVDSMEDAEDLVQSLFLELCKCNEDYKEYLNVEAYLFGMARKLIGQYYRSKRRQVKAIRIDSVGEIAASDAVQHYQEAAKGISPQELTKIIEDARPPLAPKVRQAIELKFIQRYSSKEASQKAGCSVWTFYKRLDKAAKLLEDAIKKKD